MEKIWFFVEGDSEENFIKNLIRSKYIGAIDLTNDLSDFVLKDLSQVLRHLAFCEKCSNVEKIPHRINELAYLIKRSGSSNIIIVCDLEKFPCFSEKMTKIKDIIKDKVDLNHILFAFFKPTIETGYWECERIIERIISIDYKEKFYKQLPEMPVLVNNKHPLDSLKKSFKKYNLKYRESIFSEKFFPRVDFNNCQNPVLKRIISKLDGI